VAPLSTLQHWERELHAWTWLDVVVFYGNKSAREVLLKFEWLAESHAKGEEPITHFDVCVTTYEMLLAASEPFRKVLHWGYLIVDEGHRLKNKDAKVLGVLNQLDCPHKLVLTGTPLQNNVSELFSLLHFLDPQHFLSLSSFLSQYGEIQSAEQVASLTRVLRPYLLRREKADVEVELLPLEEVLVYVEITQFQKRCYKAILEQNRKLLLRGADVKTGPSFNNVSMQLRHCCNHPYLIRGVLQAEALEDLEDAEFLSRLVQASGKTLLLEKLLPRLQQQGHRVLLFSQFAMLLDVIEDFVRMSGYSYERIDGSVTGERRQNAIDRFSNPDSSTFIFLLGTRAGGVGINLTAADTVIIFDPDWNPQNDVQAQARCHRIGQTKQVRVYRLVTRDTYEMALYERANLKLGLEQALIRHGSYGDIDGEGSSDTSAGGSAALSAPEVERLIKVGAQRLFTDEHDEQMDRFSAETIDQILERCSTSKLVSTNKGRDGTFSTFAQATFVSNEGDESVDIQDPHFWVKMLGKEPEKLTAEAAMEEDSDKQRQPQRQSKKDGILRHSDLWSRKELASLHTGLNTFGYGVPETLRAAFTALRMRNDDEVRAASEWTVSIALECETELARVDDADVWKEGRSLRVWHYLKSGSPPAPGQSLQGVPEVVHAVPCAGESAFTTHVSRVQRQAAHTIGQLVSLRRLRSAVDNAASEGSTFSAPKVPPLVLRDSTQRKELTSAKRKREDGDLDVGGEDGLDPRHEVGKACDDVTAAHVSKLENAEVGCGEAENDKGDCNSDAESEGGDCDPDIFDEEGEEESTKRSPGISDAVLGQARGSERFGGTRTLTITSAEDTELLLGVYKYGFGSYERIFSDPVFSRVGKLFSESMEHGVTSDQTPRAQGWSSFITGCALRQLNRRLKHLMLLLPPWVPPSTSLVKAITPKRDSRPTASKVKDKAAANDGAIKMEIHAASPQCVSETDNEPSCCAASQLATNLPTHVDGVALHMAPRTKTGYLNVRYRWQNTKRPYTAFIRELGVDKALGSFSTVLEAAVCVAQHMKSPPVLTSGSRLTLASQTPKQASSSGEGVASARNMQSSPATLEVGADADEEMEDSDHDEDMIDGGGSNRSVASSSACYARALESAQSEAPSGDTHTGCDDSHGTSGVTSNLDSPHPSKGVPGIGSELEVEVEVSPGVIVWKRGEVRTIKEGGRFVVCVALDEEFLEEFTLEDEGVEWRRVAQRGRLEREAAFVRSLYPRSYERQAEYGMQPPSLHTESPAGGDGPSASRAKRAEAAEQRVQEKRALKQERALAREQRFQERVQEKARVRDLKAEERAAKFEEKTRDIIEKLLREMVNKVAREHLRIVASEEALQRRGALEAARLQAKEEKQRSQVQAKKNKTFSLLEKKDEDRQQAREKKRHCRIEAKEEKKRRVEAKEEKLRLRLAERRTQRDADRQAQEERRKQEKTFAHVRKLQAFRARRIVTVSISLSLEPESITPQVKLCLAYSTESTVEEAVPIHHGFRRILVEYKPFVEPKPAYSNNHEWNVLLAKLEFGLQLKLGEGYKVRSSMGNGRWALVPYVTVSLVENNLQNDLCIEYLFCADGSGVYLALGLEAFKLKRALGSKAASRYLQEAKELVRQLGKTVLGHHCSSFDFTSRIDLRASGSPLPSSYEQGAVISQLYKKDAIPTEDELFAQLKLLFQVYEAVIMDATWIAFLDKSKEKYSALAASSAPKDGQRFEAQSDDSDSELDFETVEHVVASPAMAASQTPLGLQKPPFGQHDELGGGPLNRAFQRRAFLTFAQAARSAMNSEEPASAGLSRSSSLHSPGKLSVGKKSTKGRGKGRGKVSRRSKAISRVAVARVGCYNCDATLDDEFGVSICWSIGCDQPDCGKWACHACAGIDGALDGESYDGEWFCKEHIAHTEPMSADEPSHTPTDEELREEPGINTD